MYNNTFGNIFRLTSFGESHGKAIGGVVDGFPAGIIVDEAFIQRELDRRRPGQSALTTARKEADRVEILSGVYEGVSTGCPIGFVVWNANQHSADYDNLKDVYLEVVSQLIRYNGHVAKWVGGIYETPKTVEQAGPVYVYVEKAKQQEAMAFLDRNLFTTPEWLFDDDIFAKTGLDALFVLARVQSSALRSLLSMRVLGNLVNAEAALGKETYTLDDLFSALNKSVWSELSSGKSPDVYRRSLQNLYVERLLSLLPSGTASAGSGMEAVARVQYELRTLQGRLERASAAEPAVKAHYQYLAKRIKEKLDPK